MQFEGKPKDKRIDALAAGQAYLAYGIGMPEVAKKDRGRVFGDLYDTIFTDDISAAKLLVAHQIAAAITPLKSAVRLKIRKKEKLAKGDMSLIDGAFHVLFAVRQILLRDNRGGSVCLNSFGAIYKWISAPVMPRPGLVAAR